MILRDFLSRQKQDNINPHGVIPISFNMQMCYRLDYYNIGERKPGKHLVQTRSQTKTSGIILPEVHGIDQGLGHKVRLEKQVLKPVVTPEVKGVSQVKARLGQGRVGMKRKMIKFPVFQPFDKPEQLKLLPGRRPIIQIAVRSIQY